MTSPFTALVGVALGRVEAREPLFRWLLQLRVRLEPRLEDDVRSRVALRLLTDPRGVATRIAARDPGLAGLPLEALAERPDALRALDARFGSYVRTMLRNAERDLFRREAAEAPLPPDLVDPTGDPEDLAELGQTGAIVERVLSWFDAPDRDGLETLIDLQAGRISMEDRVGAELAATGAGDDPESFARARDRLYTQDRRLRARLEARLRDTDGLSGEQIEALIAWVHSLRRRIPPGGDVPGGRRSE